MDEVREDLVIVARGETGMSEAEFEALWASFTGHNGPDTSPATEGNEFSPAKVTPKVASYFVMDYDDWDQIVKQYVGVDSEVVADEEWGNYQCHEVSTYNDDWWNKFEHKAFVAWTQGGRYPGINTVLTGLVKEGVLPPGDYLIRVSW